MMLFDPESEDAPVPLSAGATDPNTGKSERDRRVGTLSKRERLHCSSNTISARRAGLRPRGEEGAKGRRGYDQQRTKRYLNCSEGAEAGGGWGGETMCKESDEIINADSD